jgi:hypothetical protein
MFVTAIRAFVPATHVVFKTYHSIRWYVTGISLPRFACLRVISSHSSGRSLFLHIPFLDPLPTGIIQHPEFRWDESYHSPQCTLRRSERNPASIQICITPHPGVRKTNRYHTTAPYQAVRRSCKQADMRGLMHHALSISNLFPVGGDYNTSGIC